MLNYLARGCLPSIPVGWGVVVVVVFWVVVVFCVVGWVMMLCRWCMGRLGCV